ncbi:pyocin activator PrtN family protein [Marinagarivorans algicola]|uniref:pyocin activator PrtN family protein n=1 Tax=Marinagarivorans algicola TaxID=1513270 RepID=UPI0006B65B4B|nr:pyocin activator PrtN family protein [Marinagarivorans algicola]
MKTTFMLMLEFETTDIPLKDVAKKYFGLTEVTMGDWARHRKFPFPVFRGGNQKSQWLVSVTDLAEFLDAKKQEAREQFLALKNAA